MPLPFTLQTLQYCRQLCPLLPESIEVLSALPTEQPSKMRGPVALHFAGGVPRHIPAPRPLHPALCSGQRRSAGRCAYQIRCAGDSVEKMSSLRVALADVAAGRASTNWQINAATDRNKQSVCSCMQLLLETWLRMPKDNSRPLSTPCAPYDHDYLLHNLETLLWAPQGATPSAATAAQSMLAAPRAPRRRQPLQQRAPTASAGPSAAWRPPAKVPCKVRLHDTLASHC
jgi:hypothetical protein